MPALLRQDFTAPEAPLVAICRCGTQSPLRLVLYLPVPSCTNCGRLLWEREMVLTLREAWAWAGAEGVEALARKVRLWQAGQWRQG